MSKKQWSLLIIIAIIAGGVGGILFDRTLVPRLASQKGFEWLVRYINNSPLVITRREEIVLNEGANFIELSKQAVASTVSLYQESNLSFLGNGIILSSDGLIMSSKEVTGNLSEVLVVVNDGRSFKGLVRALDPKSDLVALTIDAKDLAVLPFADAGRLQAGQKILSVGQLNREFSRDFAAGSVTRGVSDNKGFFEVFSTETLSEAFITDASFNRGFLGSPVLNLEGKLVGMVNSEDGKIIIAENMQTALSSYLIGGKITRVRLGMKYTQLSRMGAVLRGFPRAGVLVVGLEGDSAAARSGSITGDLIYEIDGQEVGGSSLEQILNRHNPAGMKVKLLRSGQEIELTVQLESTK